MVRDHSHKFLISLSIDADTSGETDLLGKSVTDLQTDIVVGTDSITGTLKHVTGYTGYSGDVTEQEGNFLALHAKDPMAEKITVEVIGGTHGAVTLDEDGIAIARITSTEQSIKYTAYKNGAKEEKVYSLENLELLSE